MFPLTLFLLGGSLDSTLRMRMKFGLLGVRSSFLFYISVCDLSPNGVIIVNDHVRLRSSFQIQWQCLQMSRVWEIIIGNCCLAIGEATSFT